MSTTTLAGKRALVTGGSRGIGAEIVRRLSTDGAAVAFTYANSATDAEKLVAQVAENGGRAVAIQADAADPAQIAAAVERAVAELGGLDVLVNNAGTAFMAPIDEFPAEQFERSVAVNVGGVYWGCPQRCCAPRCGWADHQHRQHQRRLGAGTRPIGVCADQGGGVFLHPWPGT